MKSKVLHDIEQVINDKTVCLSLSILIFTAVLPFNAFWLSFGSNFQLKISNIAFGAVIIFGLYEYFRGNVSLEKNSVILYIFVFLYPLANFLSLINSPDPWEGLRVSIAISKHSILIFVLVNVLRRQVLLRSLLSVMGILAIFLVSLSLTQYYISMPELSSRRLGEDPTLLGIGNSIYFGYIFLIYGTGLFYIFFHETAKKVRWLACIFIFMWFQVLILTATKSVQIGLFIFLCAAIVTLSGQRKAAAFFLAAYLSIFAVNLYMVSIINYMEVIRKGNGGKSTQQEVIRKGNGGKSTQQEVIRKGNGGKSTQQEVIRKGNGGKRFHSSNILKNRWLRHEGLNSIEVRLMGMLTGYEMGKAKPVLGQGVAATPRVIEHFSAVSLEKVKTDQYLPFVKYFISKKQSVFRPSDGGVFNVFVNAWAETGAVGLIAFLGIFVVVLSKCIKTVLKGKGREDKVVLKIVFPLLLGILFVHQTCYLIVGPWLWFVLSIAYQGSQVSPEAVRE